MSCIKSSCTPYFAKANYLLSPGKDYVLKYRFLVFNGKYSKEKAEAAWQSFAYAPAITIKQSNPKTK